MLVLFLAPSFAMGHGDNQFAQQLSWQEQIPWLSLTLGGSKLNSEITVEVELGPASSMGARQPWPALEEVSACATPPEGASLFSTTLSVTGMLRNHRYTEGLWLDQFGRPEKRIRYNQESDDLWLKEYCWENTGMRRSKLSPAKPNEHLLLPTGWTLKSDSWYPFPEKAAQCVAMSDPALLIAIASDLAQQQQESLSLCVFGRQHLFRLDIARETTQLLAPLMVSYTITQSSQALGQQEQRQAQVEPLVYRINAQDLHATKRRENFSLMGLVDEIRLYIDPATYLPIRLSGKAGMIGKVELNLRKVHLK
ncbi:MAG: hypothetical protein GX087_00295 [Desulfobulbaceae bacterium]|nr:hypothetical protein [Desulfobulbaceae bacterium]